MELDYVGLGLLIASVGTAIATVITAWRTSTKVDDVVRTVAVVDGKADIIKASVDGTATKAAATLEAVRDQLVEEQKRGRAEMALLRDQLVEEQKRGALQAQTIGVIAQSTKHTENVVDEMNGQAPVEASLKQIETHTKDTAKNTARTDAAVGKLKKDTT